MSYLSAIVRVFTASVLIWFTKEFTRALADSVLVKRKPMMTPATPHTFTNLPTTFDWISKMELRERIKIGL